LTQGRAPADAGVLPRCRTAREGLLLLVVLAGALAALAGCGASAAGRSAPPRAELRVFAASSLSGAFTRLGDQFMAAHPQVSVVCNFTGSQALVAQLQQGAPADVLACADTTTMASVSDLVGAPEEFARNTLAIIVPAGNPKAVRSLADLARADVKVVLAAPEVPAGRYAAEILKKARVPVRPVSLEEAAKGVVTKVTLNEADAGIVYVTDVAAAGSAVEGVAIPGAENVTAVYPIASVRTTSQQGLARQFVDLVLSPAGRRTLRAYGFLPAPTP
jgi:molybdate transport system substrate-binding protein